MLKHTALKKCYELWACIAEHNCRKVDAFSKIDSHWVLHGCFACEYASDDGHTIEDDRCGNECIMAEVWGKVDEYDESEDEDVKRCICEYASSPYEAWKKAPEERKPLYAKVIAEGAKKLLDELTEETNAAKKQ